MAKSKVGNVFMRIFITLLGVGMILWGVGTVALGLVGERGTAVITNVRREGGERADGKSGRYTYIISYTFKLPDGKSVDGYSRKISDGVYVKVKQPVSTTWVRYLKFIPGINALEDDTNPGFGQLILVAAGFFLICVMNRRR